MQKETGTATKNVFENSDDPAAAGQNLKNKFSQRADETKEKFTGNLSSAANKVHEKSDSAQQFLDNRADNLKEYAHKAIGKANQFGHRAADALNSSSKYINDFDFDKTKRQVVETIKEKPQIGFAVAGLFGLIVGWIIGKKRSK